MTKKIKKVKKEEVQVNQEIEVSKEKKYFAKTDNTIGFESMVFKIKKDQEVTGELLKIPEAAKNKFFYIK